MTRRPDDPPSIIVNSMVGEVSGNLVQANIIEGGVHFHKAARPAVSLPYRAGIVPPRAASFQDRDATAVIAGILGQGDAAVLTSGVASVVSGLGGVGKTQLAVDYAETAWAAGELDLLVWVEAGSRDAIESAYAEAAAALTGIEHASSGQGARRLLEWLASTPARWLVVLDDLQSPADLNRLWPPATATGRVVVTTRRRDAALRGHRRRMIEVDVFTPDEAHHYLTATFTGRTSLLDCAEELAAELGYLPLALAQAAAYMLDRGMSCAEYGERLVEHQRKLATLVPDEEALPDQHQATVAATWSLSIELADRLAPAGVARPLLELASVLAANGVPADVFTVPATTKLLTKRVGREVSAEQAQQGLNCLYRLSLITLDPSSAARTVRVHALVQRAVRESLDRQQMTDLVGVVADALIEAWPEVEREPELGKALRDSANALNSVAGADLWAGNRYAVLFRAGFSLGSCGAVGEAVDYFQRLHDVAARQLGHDHPDTLNARANAARFRGHAGDPAGATRALEDVLSDRLRVLGRDHPDTMTTRANIARFRGQAGDPFGAAHALEELLPDRLRVLGPDHPYTLITRFNLARWRRTAGDLAGSAEVLAELLPDQLRVLGSDHPDTLTTRHAIAYCRGQGGDPASAAHALEELFPDRLRVLGPDHPDTLTTRVDIARFRAEAGDPAGAAKDLEKLLLDEMRVLGRDHPHTLTTRHEIGHWLGQAGNPAAATSVLEELLPDRLRVLGPDHPDTLITRHEIAVCQGQSGDPAGAATALGELLHDFLRVLGREHPNTLTARHSLGYWSAESGNPARAATVFEELLTDYRRVLGPNHRDTVTTFYNLAYLRKILSTRKRKRLR